MERLPISGTPFPFGLSFVPPEALSTIVGPPGPPAHTLTVACAELGASFAFVPADAWWCEDAVSALSETVVAPLLSISGPLWPVIEARGTAEGLRASLTQPEQVGFELDRRLDGLTTEVARAARLGMRGVVLAEDLAGSEGPLVAPDFAIAELVPRYERVVRAARSLNMPAIFHSDGDVRPLLTAIARAGFVAIHGGGGLEFPAFERLFWAAREEGLAVMGGLLTTGLINPAAAEALGSKVGILAKAGGLFVADDGGITTPAEVASLVVALGAARDASGAATHKAAE